MCAVFMLLMSEYLAVKKQTVIWRVLILNDKKNEQIGTEKVFLHTCSLIVELRESLNIACK